MLLCAARFAPPCEGADPFTPMYKLIGILVAAAPIVLFLRAILVRHSKKRSQALSDFKRQLDYLVGLLLIVIGCVVAYSIGKLIYQFLS
jgi:threonine/homoserine/homoserine lactone efflux protein